MSMHPAEYFHSLIKPLSDPRKLDQIYTHIFLFLMHTCCLYIQIKVMDMPSFTLLEEKKCQLIQEMKHKTHLLSGQGIRPLYSTLLDAQTNFSPKEYDCFRKCVKIAFDLGSVSIYRHQALDFFMSVQKYLS